MNALRRAPKLLTALALVALVVAATAGHRHSQALTAKTAEQQENLAALTRFRDSYDRLAPVDERWRTVYAHRVSGVTDAHRALELADLAGANLATDTALLQLATADPMTENGIPLGIERRCLTTLGKAGLVVTAHSFDALLDGIARLTARPEIEVARVNLNEGAAPAASLQSFCLRLRSTP